MALRPAADRIPPLPRSTDERHFAESGLPAVRRAADLVLPASGTGRAAIAGRMKEHLLSPSRVTLAATGPRGAPRHAAQDLQQTASGHASAD